MNSPEILVEKGLKRIVVSDSELRQTSTDFDKLRNNDEASISMILDKRQVPGKYDLSGYVVIASEDVLRKEFQEQEIPEGEWVILKMNQTFYDQAIENASRENVNAAVEQGATVTRHLIKQDGFITGVSVNVSGSLESLSPIFPTANNK